MTNEHKTTYKVDPKNSSMPNHCYHLELPKNSIQPKIGLEESHETTFKGH